MFEPQNSKKSNIIRKTRRQQKFDLSRTPPPPTHPLLPPSTSSILISPFSPLPPWPSPSSHPPLPSPQSIDGQKVSKMRELRIQLENYEGDLIDIVTKGQIKKIVDNLCTCSKELRAEYSKIIELLTDDPDTCEYFLNAFETMPKLFTVLQKCEKESMESVLIALTGFICLDCENRDYAYEIDGFIEILKQVEEFCTCDETSYNDFLYLLSSLLGGDDSDYLPDYTQCYELFEIACRQLNKKVFKKPLLENDPYQHSISEFISTILCFLESDRLFAKILEETEGIQGLCEVYFICDSNIQVYCLETLEILSKYGGRSIDLIMENGFIRVFLKSLEKSSEEDSNGYPLKKLTIACEIMSTIAQKNKKYAEFLINDEHFMINIGCYLWNHEKQEKINCELLRVLACLIENGDKVIVAQSIEKYLVVQILSKFLLIFTKKVFVENILDIVCKVLNLGKEVFQDNRLLASFIKSQGEETVKRIRKLSAPKVQEKCDAILKEFFKMEEE